MRPSGQAFRDDLEDYIQRCLSLGEVPQKPLDPYGPHARAVHQVLIAMARWVRGSREDRRRLAETGQPYYLRHKGPKACRPE